MQSVEAPTSFKVLLLILFKLFFFKKLYFPSTALLGHLRGASVLKYRDFRKSSDAANATATLSPTRDTVGQRTSQEDDEHPVLSPRIFAPYSLQGPNYT